MRPRSGQKRWCRPEAQARSRAVSLRSPFHSDPSWRRCDSHAHPIIRPTYSKPVRDPDSRPVQPLVSSSAHPRGPLGRDPAALGSNCVDAFLRRATVHGTDQVGSGRGATVEYAWFIMMTPGQLFTDSRSDIRARWPFRTLRCDAAQACADPHMQQARPQHEGIAAAPRVFRDVAVFGGISGRRFESQAAPRLGLELVIQISAAKRLRFRLVEIEHRGEQ